MKTLLSPIVIANIDDSDEPSFQGNYRKSIIIDRYSRKIGIIGVILSTVNVRKNIFHSFDQTLVFNFP